MLVFLKIMYYNKIMKKFQEEYLNLQTSHKKSYIKNNEEISDENISSENLFYYIDDDLDIVFRLLRISPNKIGFKYWKDCIFMYIISETDKINIGRELYPYIAEKYAKSSTSIERAMRLCFDDSLYQLSKSNSNYVLSYMYDYLLFPQNSKILCRIAELICNKRFQREKRNLTKIYYQ